MPVESNEGVLIKQQLFYVAKSKSQFWYVLMLKGIPNKGQIHPGVIILALLQYSSKTN